MFLTRKKLIIQPGEKIHWVNIADTKADHTRLVNLMAQFESNDELLNNVFQAVQNEQKGLRAQLRWQMDSNAQGIKPHQTITSRMC